MSEFKIGDRVRVVGTSLFEDSNMGKEGVVYEYKHTGSPRVRFDDGTTDWGRADELELVTPKFAFKIGDRVKIKPDAITTHTDHVDAKRKGKTGEIIDLLNSSWRVRWNDGRTSSLLTNDMLMPAHAIPDEITVNGEKYRRVVDDKPEEPKKPEPKAGQVWKYNGYYILVTNNDRNVIISNGQIGQMTHKRIQETSTFVADSLADALENGKITPADLRR